MSNEKEFLLAYESVQKGVTTAMRQVENAFSLEEEAKQEPEVIAAYEQALAMIDDVLAISIVLPDNIDNVQTEWKHACVIIENLKSKKNEVTNRLKNLHTNLATGINAEEADARDCAVQLNSDANKRPKLYSQIIGGLRELIASKDANVHFDTLFQAQVKLYKIEANGVVTTLSRETSMSLVMCNVVEQWSYLNGSYFIQCAIPDEDLSLPDGATNSKNNMIWIYPLIPRITNCYKTSYGAFIFPDVEKSKFGNAFGILLTKPQLPLLNGSEDEENLADLQQFFLDLLEAILSVPVNDFVTQGSDITSEQVSKNIVCAADFIARNLIKGAEKTGDLMVKGTPFVISKMQPASAPASIPSSVQTSVEIAQKVTHAAASFTGWMGGKVGTASLACGRYLAPHIQAQGSRLLEKGFGYDTSEANNKMEGAMTIAAGAVVGFTTVYSSLETSAKILGNNLSRNSVKIIEHKYGSSAGNLAAGTFDTMGNAFVVSQNVNYVTPKGLAKKMAKKTGEAVIDDYKRCLRVNQNPVMEVNSLYPDLRNSKSTLQ